MFPSGQCGAALRRAPRKVWERDGRTRPARRTLEEEVAVQGPAIPPGSTYLPAEVAEEGSTLAALRRFRRPCTGLAAPERFRPSKPRTEDLRMSAFSVFHPSPHRRTGDARDLKPRSARPYGPENQSPGKVTHCCWNIGKEISIGGLSGAKGFMM